MISSGPTNGGQEENDYSNIKRNGATIRFHPLPPMTGCHVPQLPAIPVTFFLSPSFFYVAFKLSFIVGNWEGTFSFLGADNDFSRFLTVWAT